MKSKFYIPLNQRFGMMTLIILILVIHNIDTIYDRIAGPSKEEKINMVKDILSENAIQTIEENGPAIKTTQSDFDISNLSRIDPNLASKEELAKYGLSKYAINNLEKYRSKGGLINTKEDLLKIYGIDTSIVEAIKHKLILPSKESSKFKKKFKNNLQANTKSKPIENDAINNKANEHSNSYTPQKNLPFFDPNTATKSELLKQGVSTYAANNLLKYRSKGGKIYKADDLSKIYGIDSASLAFIFPRIRIEKDTSNIESSSNLFATADKQPNNNKSPEQSSAFKQKAESIQSLNINTATKEQLIAIRGIGPVISKGIVEYRDKLGGYHSLDQLLEVYGITDENHDSLIESLHVEGEIKKFYPAATSFKNLVRHPYIDYETTKLLKSFSIMNYSEDLQRIIDQGKVDKRLLPYIYISDPEGVTIKN